MTAQMKVSFLISFSQQLRFVIENGSHTWSRGHSTKVPIACNIMHEGFASAGIVHAEIVASQAVDVWWAKYACIWVWVCRSVPV